MYNRNFNVEKPFHSIQHLSSMIKDFYFLKFHVFKKDPVILKEKFHQGRVDSKQSLFLNILEKKNTSEPKSL